MATTLIEERLKAGKHGEDNIKIDLKGKHDEDVS
jgi:hypothetical protein